MLASLKKAEWIFCLAVLFFSIVYWFLVTIPYLQKPMISSEDGYSRLASGVAWSSPITRYPINYVWPPLTPILYSLAYIIYPYHQYISIRIFAWILIFFTCVITGFIGFRLSKNIKIGIFSASLAFVNPLLINISTQTLSENIWLPLVGLSLFFLFSKSQKSWLIGMIFWSLSQTVRYESWYLGPLLIIIFWFYHRQLKATIIFAILSLVFPAYWYIETTLSTGNTHFYLDEKLFQAKHGNPYIYHHLFPSIRVWIIPLIHSLSIPLIFLFIVGSRFFTKQKNYLFVLPIFIFVSLIAQVYLATMEISPARYLGLLPIVMIPIAVFTIFKKSASSKIAYSIILALLALDIYSANYRLQKLKDLLFPEQIEVGNFISKSQAPCISYLKSELSPRFDNSAFWYFSNQPMTQIVFQRVANPYQLGVHFPANCYTFVIEKTADHPQKGETLPPIFGTPKFENYYFQVYEPQFMIDAYTNGKSK